MRSVASKMQCVNNEHPVPIPCKLPLFSSIVNVFLSRSVLMNIIEILALWNHTSYEEGFCRLPISVSS